VKNKHDIENNIKAVRLHAMANKGKGEIDYVIFYPYYIEPMEKQGENRIVSERKFWNSKAKEYDKVVNKLFLKIYETIGDNLIQDTNQSENLLEVATGTGILAIKLSDQVAHITAVDIAPEMLIVAKEKSDKKQINNIDFKIGDICNLKFDDKSFDTVVASNVLHLLFQPELALQEISRVLDDHGRMVAPTFCHGANLRSQILSRLLSLLGQKTRSRWSRKGFIEFVEQNGFKTTKIIYVNGMIPLTYLVAMKK
jgi:ubiquinone/menaquinone biosynthesis C-methylase UbiE